MYCIEIEFGVPTITVVFDNDIIFVFFEPQCNGEVSDKDYYNVISGPLIYPIIRISGPPNSSSIILKNGSKRFQ